MSHDPRGFTFVDGQTAQVSLSTSSVLSVKGHSRSKAGAEGRAAEIRGFARSLRRV